jgi:bacterioferritin-associated ferredoxin
MAIRRKAISLCRALQFGPIPAGTFSAMIVCSCNVFTDHDVRSTLSSGDNVPRTTGQVYHCLGCSAQCGRCARTIRRIMDETLAAAGSTCCRDGQIGS